MNEGLITDQSVCGDTILGYDEARTEIGMDNKKTLSPVGPHQNIIYTQESRRVGRTRTKQNDLQLVRKSGGFADLALRFEQLGQGLPDYLHRRR